MKIIGAYTLTDLRTGKFYVGSSGDIEKRFKRHFDDLQSQRHHCPGLQKLWNDYGRLRQSTYPTETREQAYELEQDMLDRFKGSVLLLNVGLSVRGGDNLTRNPRRSEIVAAIKESVREKLSSLTPLERKQLFGLPGARNGMFGRTHTEEVRAKLAEVHRGNKYCLGLKRSDEQRRQISEMAKRRVGELNSFHGKSHSEETKRHLSTLAKSRNKIPGNARSVVVGGQVYKSLTEASRQLQVSPALMVYRINSKSSKYRNYHYIDECPSTIESTVGA